MYIKKKKSLITFSSYLSSSVEIISKNKVFLEWPVIIKKKKKKENKKHG